jgi:hypothetical protein
MRTTAVACILSTLLSSTAWAHGGGHFGGAGLRPAFGRHMSKQAPTKARTFNAPMAKAMTFARPIAGMKKIEHRGDLPKQPANAGSVVHNWPGPKSPPWGNTCEACPPHHNWPMHPIPPNRLVAPGSNVSSVGGPIEWDIPWQGWAAAAVCPAFTIALLGIWTFIDRAPGTGPSGGSGGGGAGGGSGGGGGGTDAGPPPMTAEQAHQESGAPTAPTVDGGTDVNGDTDHAKPAATTGQ